MLPVTNEPGRYWERLDTLLSNPLMSKSLRNYYKFHIFSPGTHTSASGTSVSLTKEDLEKTALNLKKTNFRSPFILGHSTHNHQDVMPALGWIKDAKVDTDGKLYALVEPTKAGQAFIDGNYLQNCSVSFYSPDSPLNPNPGTWAIRHLAGLSAEVPALKDLDPLLAIIPDDFSESKKSYHWSSVPPDESEFVFSEVMSLLPENHQFQSFSRYGGSFRAKSSKKPQCAPGNKPCKGRCIRSDWVCHADGASTARRTARMHSGFRGGQGDELADENGSVSPEKTKPIPVTTEYRQNYERKQEKNKAIVGSLKALGALAISVGASYGAKKAFPDSKAAQAGVEILGKIGANQLVLAPDADRTNRLNSALLTTITQGMEIGILAANPNISKAEKTVVKTGAQLIQTALTGSGLFNVKVDTYANSIYTSATILHNSLQYLQQDVKNVDNKQRAENQEKIDLATSGAATIKDVIDVNTQSMSQVAERLSDLEDSLNRQTRKNKQNSQMIDFVYKSVKDGTMTPDLTEKLNTVQEAYDSYNTTIDVEGKSFSETYNFADENPYGEDAPYGEEDIYGNEDPYGEEDIYDYSNLQIKFTYEEVMALIQPLSFMILKDSGLLDAVLKDPDRSSFSGSSEPTIKEVVTKKANELDTVFSEYQVSNHELDAIFSELKIAPFKVVKPTITNNQLEESLYSKKIPDDKETIFQEKQNNELTEVKQRIYVNGSIVNSGTNESRPDDALKDISLDKLIDNAFSEAENRPKQDNEIRKIKIAEDETPGVPPGARYVRSGTSFKEGGTSRKKHTSGKPVTKPLPRINPNGKSTFKNNDVLDGSLMGETTPVPTTEETSAICPKGLTSCRGAVSPRRLLGGNLPTQNATETMRDKSFRTDWLPKTAPVRNYSFMEQQIESARVREKDLENQLKTFKAKSLYLETEMFAENLYREGKLTEGLAKKSELIAFLMGLEESNSDSFDFGEVAAVNNPTSFMRKLLNNIQPVVSFQEIDRKENRPDLDMMPQPRFQEGYDLESQKIDLSIQKMMAQNPEMDYYQAFKQLKR